MIIMTTINELKVLMTLIQLKPPLSGQRKSSEIIEKSFHLIGELSLLVASQTLVKLEMVLILKIV